MLSKQSWFVLFLAVIWIALTALFIPPPKNTGSATPKEGFPAPDFELYSFDGSFYQLSQLKGKPIIINFWASWCSPCRQEMPALQKVFEEYSPDTLQILAVNVTNQDNERSVEQFISSNLLTFPILFDESGNVSTTYRVDALPTTFFIDKSGVISDIVIGGPMSEALIRSKVETIMRGDK